MIYAIIGAVGLALFAGAYLLVRAFYKSGKALGASNQKLDNTDGAREAEQEMGEVITERRETSTTKERLDDGTF